MTEEFQLSRVGVVVVAGVAINEEIKIAPTTIYSPERLMVKLFIPNDTPPKNFVLSPKLNVML